MQLQKAIPGLDFVKFFQNVIRPYKDGNGELWMLSKLDNDDKHNFILPTVAIGNIFQGFMIVEGPGPMGIRLNSRASNDASQPFAFVRLDASNGIPAHSEVKMTASIRFPHGQFFGGEEVVSVLEKLCSIVTDTLKSFDNFVASSGLNISPGVWVDMYGSLDAADNA